jgi:hypothetical protein
VGDFLRFEFGSGQGAFGDTLTDPLHHLAHLAEQDSQGAVQDPGFKAALRMEDIACFPKLRFSNTCIRSRIWGR